MVPDASRQSGIRVYTVDDAKVAYQQRYKELLPAQAEVANGTGPVVGVGLGFGPAWGWGYRGWGGRNFGGANRGFRGGSRPVGVSANSYRRRN